VFGSACTGASVAWGALGELQQAPMATAHRVSGTPTPGRSARAGRKRDGIPWHSPLAEVVKGALYRVFWTPGITRRLQVQHPSFAVEPSNSSVAFCCPVAMASGMFRGSTHPSIPG